MFWSDSLPIRKRTTFAKQDESQRRCGATGEIQAGSGRWRRRGEERPNYSIHPGNSEKAPKGRIGRDGLRAKQTLLVCFPAEWKNESYPRPRTLSIVVNVCLSSPETAGTFPT